MLTRYVVDLDAGGVLVVVRQNLETTSAEVVQARGRTVRLEWRPDQTYVIDGTGEREEADD
jgi:putative spermidine/putrescine transport system ATP-binding protein